MKYLIIDGMISGTGIRDAVEGGYIKPPELGLSIPLIDDIKLWLSRYEEAHYTQFVDAEEVIDLDLQGLALSRRLIYELPSVKVQYFSNAKMQMIKLD